VRWPSTWLRRAAEAPATAAPVPATGGPPGTREEYASWGFEEGAEIAPGRHALQRLGGGSSYEVYLVWDERLYALAVAKVLRPDAAADAGSLRDLAREAEALARLSHPGLVRSFGATLDGPRPHLLLEHLDGPTLQRLVRRNGALPLEQLLPLALHLAAVLHFVASEGFVHLDVKPGNVVVGVPPRLLDLSIARTVESAAALRHAIGTDAYMAPEQCDPAARPGAVGPPADVWGLGATLYHAATGAVPFPRPREARRSEDRAARFPQLVREADPPSGLPPLFAELLLATLAPDPSRRPAAREVADALEPLVAEVPERFTVTRRLHFVAQR
jgi:serine/threonine protein kinase